MKEEFTAVEDSLRALKWRAPADHVLEQSLHAALAARREIEPRRRVLDFIPRALRWPLAACWTASLAFWWLTPKEQTSTATTIAIHKSAPDPASLMAQQESTRQLTHELLLALEDHGRWR